MSDRERWIVYPLLFLALGISVKNGISLRMGREEQASERLSCRVLTLEADDGRRVRLRCGSLEEPTLEIDGAVLATGPLRLVDRQGRPLVTAGGGPAGGLVVAFDHDNLLHAALGHGEGEAIGVFKLDAKTGLIAEEAVWQPAEKE